MFRGIAGVMILFALTGSSAQGQTGSELRNRVTALQAAAEAFQKDVARDVEILGLISRVATELRDWQPHVSLTRALESIEKAERLALEAPPASPQVRQAIRRARIIIEPVVQSPSIQDRNPIIEDLHHGPIHTLMRLNLAAANDAANLQVSLSGIQRTLATAQSRAVGGIPLFPDIAPRE